MPPAAPPPPPPPPPSPAGPPGNGGYGGYPGNDPHGGYGGDRGNPPYGGNVPYGAAPPPPYGSTGLYGGNAPYGRQDTYGGAQGGYAPPYNQGYRYGQVPPPPPPSPGGRRWGPAAVALAGVMAVVAAGVGVTVLQDRGPGHPDEWDPRVADLAQFVEDTRGLRFEHPVYVDFLTGEEYSERVRSDAGELTDEDEAALESTVAMLRALGLASGDVDLFEAGNDLEDNGTLAFYDPTSERITVRGTEIGVELKVTLVHEMTHALQDQRFDLDGLQSEIIGDVGDDLDSDDPREASKAESEANTAFSGYQALVEGDAVRIENAYVDSLSDADRDSYFSSYQESLDQADAELGEVPAALRAFQAVPYALGQPLVDLVAADGGNAGVDGMFEDLPSTEEHMLDPLTYIEQRQEPTSLPSPALPDGVADDDVVDEGTMGAVELYIVLAERIDPLEAMVAADGWGNSTFVSYETGDRTCVRLLVDGDRPADDQQLHSGFLGWAAASPATANAVVTDAGDGRTQIESCDPGTETAPGNDRGVDALTVPVVRSQVTSFAVQDGADLAGAWRSGDCFVHQLTFDQMVAINNATGDLPPDQQALLNNATQSCAPQ